MGPRGTDTESGAFRAGASPAARWCCRTSGRRSGGGGAGAPARRGDVRLDGPRPAADGLRSQPGDPVLRHRHAPVLVVVGGRVPSYLGSSFAFIAVVIAATGYGGSGPNPNLPVALGGIIAAGAVYALIGIAVGDAGRRCLDRPADAAGGDRGDRRGDRHQPRADRREGHLGLRPRCRDRAVHDPGGRPSPPPTCRDPRGACRSSSGRWPPPCSTACWPTASASPNPTVSSRSTSRGSPRRRGSAGRILHAGLRGLRVWLIAPVALVMVAENLGHVKAIGAMTGRNSIRISAAPSSATGSPRCSQGRSAAPA